MARFLIPILALALASCATTGSGPGWGTRATAAPGWDRLGRAAVTAAFDPFTWAPAVGAVGLQIANADQEIAEWAMDRRPIFGNPEAARDASDWLRAGGVGAYLGAGLMAPSPEGRWLRSKAKGFAPGGAAILATVGTTGLLKDVVDRERPLAQEDKSFPSGHTSTAAVGARLARHTLTSYKLSHSARLASDMGLAALAGMTGWARVEAGKHHPADALVGATLGNFFSVFATEAFLDGQSSGPVRLTARPLPAGMAVELSGRLGPGS